MKAALVYTSTTPELIETVEAEVKRKLGNTCEIISYQNPEILALARAAGYVTKEAAAKLVSMYMQAIEEGADAILNLCSSVGLVADAAQELAKFTGVPIVRVDEEMCREAVRTGKRIGVLATLPTTLEPTKLTILRVAREMDRRVELVDGLIDGAFGINQEQFKQMLLDQSLAMQEKVDVILLAQGSMAYAEQVIYETTRLPVLSSPRFGAEALRRALESKGLVDSREGSRC